MSEHVFTTNDADFDADVLQEKLPVLVDFWAEWCQPCKMISPVVDDVAKEYHGRLKVVKINVDENTEIPSKYGVRGIPSLLLFKGGSVIATKVGAMSKSQLASFVEEHI